MIQAFAGKAKMIALILLCLFYTEFVLGNYILIIEIPGKYERNYSNSDKQYNIFNKQAITSFRPANQDSFLPKEPSADAPLEQFVPQANKENIGGPTQPEMQSFQTVNNANMVDLFTGDFSYNIPLLDVGGYPVNIFYRSGITMDDEASWVGLGWNVNPGTITRNVRGIPDDFNGKTDTITKITAIRDNLTFGATIGGSLEIKGLPILQASGSVGAFYNNYSGYGVEYDLNASISSGTGNAGKLTGGLGINNSSATGLSLKPSLDVTLTQLDSKENTVASGGVSIGAAYNSRSGLKSLQVSGTGLKLTTHLNKNQRTDNDPINLPGINSTISFVSPSYSPTITMPYSNWSYTLTVKPGGEFIVAHPNIFFSGYVSKQGIAASDRKRVIPAYGYLHYQDAVNIGDALLDFNREKEIIYQEKPELPNIAVPSYTYDIFSISGEGTGGMFRPYRSDIGYINDHAASTKDNSGSLSADFGGGNLVHGGTDLNFNHSKTTSGAWVQNNQLASTITFRQNDSSFEAVYFKNPGEKTINTKDFYDAVGGDDVVTAALYQNGLSPSTIATNYLHRYRNKNFTGDLLLTAQNSYKAQRDKRSQVISYLNAEEATKVGLDRQINNYTLNQWGSSPCSNYITKEARVNAYRKANHLSEIDVLNTDGRRYIYGLPVYNLSQKEVSYSIATGDKSTGLANYNSIDDSTSNTQGKEHYYNAELTPSYAHTFLLTGILSPDYVDLTGDGISDDDPGDGIRFNYSKVAGNANPFSWRAPNLPGKVTYNEGLQTYNRDDKGSYIYGQKELWYLHSIESKNMVAVFMVENRSDISTVQKDGNTITDTIPKRLKEIRLYTKADYLKNGLNAISIKTVHFNYTYDLCKGINGNINQGKLTLKKVWFTYNGNDKGVKNPYIFNYTGNNPSYNTYSNDRWGNYKNAAANTKGGNAVSNADYPYAVQDSVTAAYNASAWTLDSIKTPSGARIKVSYESDDYAFVQNKRAMQMFNVIGLSRTKPTSLFGANGSGNLLNILYDYTISVNNNPDNLYVGIRVATPVSSNQEVFQKYLDGIDKLYFKLKVQMPTDRWGSGYEYIPCYADIDKAATEYYGYLTGNATVIWIKLKGISLQGDKDGSYSPLAKAAIQFLRMNLPSKAYPGSEVGDDFSPASAVKVIGALGKNIVDGFESFDRTARKYNWVYMIDTNRTIARLNNPMYKKYGGGVRVKSVAIYDNWHLMTNQKEATYGQIYTYTTIKNISGVSTLISSGVASYEPMIGGEENPWRQPLEYTEKVSPLAPVTLGYTEEPLGETFFPSPSVGYSDVKVRSINTQGTKSANGLEETTFYTSYDFPTIVDHSMLSPENVKRYKSPLTSILRINTRHYLNMSQGFKIELNDMNGKIRSQSTFSENDFTTPISYTENLYQVDDKNAEIKHLNNTVSVINKDGVIDTAAVIGKDIELMTDMREQSTQTIGADINVDVDIFVIGIFPAILGGILPLPQFEENRFRSVAITKIIHRYGILDSIVVIDKGSKVSTENLLYDSETGEPLLTRTRNEFNDTIYNIQYPAHWVYSGMGMAYKNISASFSSSANKTITIANGVLTNYGKYPGLLNNLESGDELLVYGREKIGEDTLRNCSGAQKGCIVPIFDPNTIGNRKIWVVSAKKIDSAAPANIIFLDSAGTPYSGTDLTIKIIRSGKRNIGSTPVGTITCMKNPLKVINGVLKMVPDSTTQVINTTAAVYKDDWKVKDYLYLKDSAVSSFQNASITLNPSSITTFTKYYKNGEGDKDFTKYINSNNILAGYEYYDNNPGGGGCNGKNYKYKTAVNFNFNSIPYRSTIVSASFSFTNKVPTDFSYHMSDDGNCNRNYDYTQATASHLGQSVSYLKRITTPWSSSTSFNNITTTETNRLTVDYNINSSLACTSLVQDMVNMAQPYGLLLQIQKDNPTNAGDNEVNFLNFCANTSSGCTAPVLNITYLQPTYTHYYVCRSPVTQRSVNPYIYGLFGNWRMDKAYVYYGDRKEANIADSANIRTNGAIKNYMPYWSFQNNQLKATTDTVNWVWNTQTTMYNRRGMEIENKDPLGRYNSGQYGYNDALPVTVTQNSTNKEQFFDGFEDYAYSSQNCPVSCVLPLNMDFTKYKGIIVDSVHHSGKYSLLVKADSSISMPANITSAVEQSGPDPLTILIDTSSHRDTIVSPSGDGIIKPYYSPLNCGGTISSKITSYQTNIQPDTTGFYEIKVDNITCYACGSGSASYNISITGKNVVIIRPLSGGSFDTTITLLAGEVYNVVTSTGSSTDPSRCYMDDLHPPVIQWARLNNCSGGSTLKVVPAQYLYSSGKGAVTYDTNQCTRVKALKAFNDNLLPGTAFKKGQKYIFSCWVREEQDCSCDSFKLNSVKFTFTDSSNTTTTKTLAASGNIIEGWQRYEDTVTVPTNAKAMNLSLQSTGHINVYFDDIRMHPYNAIMQSFVYNPVNLRLMAQLDENNYSTFYEYDDDGTLIRLKKETEKGIKTIKETRSSLSTQSDQ